MKEITKPNLISASHFTAARVESGTPSAYRLARKPNGDLVLQGAYVWQEGFTKSGHEWRDVPTVEAA